MKHFCRSRLNHFFLPTFQDTTPNNERFCIVYLYYEVWRHGLSRKCMFLVKIQAAITGVLTFYWSGRTASTPSTLLIQWTVRINRFWQLGSVHKIHIYIEATSPFRSSSIDKFRFLLPYPEMTGGVMSMTGPQFLQINGFSNMFEGWGGEDDDLYRRIVGAGLGLERLSVHHSR